MLGLFAWKRSCSSFLGYGTLWLELADRPNAMGPSPGFLAKSQKKNAAIALGSLGVLVEWTVVFWYVHRVEG